MDLTVDEDGYNSSTGSINEDAELELSCALHDLALKVKTFEANMQGQFKQGQDEDEEEITEDFDYIEEEGDDSTKACEKPYESAFPGLRRKKSADYKMENPQYDDLGSESDELKSDEEDERPEAKSTFGESKSSDEGWDFQEDKEELGELKQNIAKLLTSMRKALDDNQADCKAVN